MKDHAPAAPPRTNQPQEVDLMNHPTLDTHTDRWHVILCTRCLGSIEPGGEAFTSHVSKYEPMNPGPDWEATGDWASPVQLGGCLCGSCRAALQAFLMGWDDNYERHPRSVNAHLDARRESR